jgi:hypothetical protein
MLASGANEWVKEAAFANPNIVSSELEHGGLERAA